MSRGNCPFAARIAGAVVITLVIVVVGQQQRALAGAPNPQLDGLLPTALNRAYQQLSLNLSPPNYPIYTDPQGIWVTDRAWYWSSGFWPGELWLANELSGSGSWTSKAQTWTNGVQSQDTDTTTHDVGYKIFPPYMNGYRLAGTASYPGIIITAAGSMATRYSSVVGCIKSFEASSPHTGQFPVEIDNMPTLEMLFWAARNGGQAAWRDMAVSHALRTRATFIHPTNNGTYHVVWFDPATGAVIYPGTLQGYGDTSTWSRGQAWGIYGFTMCCRETGDSRFLATAQTLADYYLSRLPADMVPPWDFDTGQPSPPKDSSAAAIVAAALLNLSCFVQDSATSQRYWDAACSTLVSLCSSTYLGNGTNSQGILLHGTYNKVTNTGVDASQIWGDYYFLQAIDRYRYLSSTSTGSHTSSATWRNWPMSLQRGTFRVEFDVVPNGAAIDAVTALSAGSGTAYVNCAAQVRFNSSGYIDVRNGGAYRAAVSTHYTAGTSYHVRMDVDVPHHTYSVYVTPSAGSQVTLATNYAFRTEQAGATYLDNWGFVCETGTHTISSFQVTGPVHNLTRDIRYLTVQEAIDDAVDGNEIVLDPGIYTGPGNRDIRVSAKSLTLRSTNPDDATVVAATVIDCQGSQSDPHGGFSFEGYVQGSLDRVLDGLTIIHGCSSAGAAVDFYGGVGDPPSALVKRCVITDCIGSAIKCEYGSLRPTIEGCTISGNQGVGIEVSNTGLNITACTIVNNVGGILCHGDASRAVTTITNCKITGNNGHGVSTYKSLGVVITSCLIANNAGSGIAWSDSLLTISNCTIAGNRAEAGNCIYATSLLYHGDFINIRNSILWPDPGVPGPAIVLDMPEPNGDTLTVTYSDVKGGRSGVSLPRGVWGSITWDAASKDVDPLFVSPAGPDGNPATWADNDYHLALGSPCINTGDPAYIPASGETDIDGQTRVLNGRVDMGADEFLAGDINGDGHVDSSDLLILARSWAKSVGQPGFDASCDFNGNGSVNVVDLLFLADNWGT